MSNDDASVMVWEEARRLLVRQEAEVDLLRSRSVWLLAAAAVVAALFVSHLPKNLEGRHLWATVAALVVFGAMAVLVLAVQWPRDLGFSRDLDSHIARMDEGDTPSVLTFAHDSAKDANRSRAQSTTMVNQMHWWFRWACVLLGVQVLVWALAVL